MGWSHLLLTRVFHIHNQLNIQFEIKQIIAFITVMIVPRINAPHVSTECVLLVK